MTRAIGVKLTAEPLRLTMEERKDFKISIAATNRGDETVDPELHRAQLLINGEDSNVWGLAIANGKREAKWFALPPGETVSMTWSSMGASLFPNPGTFDLVLRFQDRELAPLHAEVTE
ncbi:MAG: hypothetical protein ACRDJG_08365 [Actinomycetota bacterium]